METATVTAGHKAKPLTTRHIGIGLVVAAIVSLPVSARASESSASTGAAGLAESYPWSERSETVRVPMSFLAQLHIQPVQMSDRTSWQFELREEFIEIFRLTAAEVAGVKNALDAALDEFRTEEGRHLVPTNAPALAWPGGVRGTSRATNIEEFYFSPTPFPKEAAAIRRKLEAAILVSLGEDRSRRFWTEALPWVESEMPSIPAPAQRADVLSTNTYTFMLRATGAIPEIQIMQTHVNVSSNGRGFGGGGRHSSEALDRYAPESMRPVLARWRRMIAEASAAPDLVNRSALPIAQVIVPHEEGEKWRVDLPFADLPKRHLPALRVPIFTDDGVIADLAAIVFGLTVNERRSIRDWFGEMKARFEELESAHFERVAQTTFVVRAFPRESAALQREWLAGLVRLVGTNRADLLDRAMRVPPFVTIEDAVARTEAELTAARDGQVPTGPKGPHWFARGSEDLRIEVVVGQDSRGAPTQRFEFRGSSDNTGSFGHPIGQIPARWKHLLTPGMLKPVEPPAAF